MTLEEVDRRAKNLGLSYGKYVATYRPNEEIKPRREQSLSDRISGSRRKHRGLLSRAQSRERMRDVSDLIINKYANGGSLKSIAQDLSVTEFELARFLEKAGLSRRECKNFVQERTREEILRSGVVPCAVCKSTRCDDRKMCKTYKKWVKVKWNEAVAPFRALRDAKS